MRQSITEDRRQLDVSRARKKPLQGLSCNPFSAIITTNGQFFALFAYFCMNLPQSVLYVRTYYLNHEITQEPHSFYIRNDCLRRLAALLKPLRNYFHQVFFR